MGREPREELAMYSGNRDMKGSLHFTRLAEDRKSPCWILGFLRVMEILVEICSLMIGYFENLS